MSVQLPPIPANVPTLIESSFSNGYGPAHHGIDVDTQWWCEAVRRPRFGDVIARVTAPGAGLHNPLLTLTLGAEDLDEAEAVGHYAIRITRALVRVMTDHDDAEALEHLKYLLSSSGPLGRDSQHAWHRTMEWLPAARTATTVDRIPKLDLLGAGFPVELWTVSMVAKHLGFTGPSANGSARKQLSRWGIGSQGREPGRRGESQYPADMVKAAHAARPGSGRRAAARDGGKFAAQGDVS